MSILLAVCLIILIILSLLLKTARTEVAQIEHERTQMRHDLDVIHNLLTSLHQATDSEDVQEKILEAVTTQLRFKRAVIGLVDSTNNTITSWIGRVPHQTNLSRQALSHPARLPLTPMGGLVAQALLEQRICRADDAPCTTDAWINTYFGMSGCLILPMVWGIQPIGVLLVDAVELPPNAPRLRVLESITQQTAVVLGIMTTRLRRAKESAVQAERARIAMDIHDTVSQSLFGLTYTLNGSLKLLDKDLEATRNELIWAQETAESVRQALHDTIHDLWPQTPTAAHFEADLRRYAADVLQATALHIQFDVRGHFATLSPQVNRSLYRICQEGLTNIVHHAGATEARICLDIAAGQARLVIRDNGRGFEPITALNQKRDDQHFGLRGMQKRAQQLGGTCDIFSQPTAGTSLVIDIPANEQ